MSLHSALPLLKCGMFVGIIASIFRCVSFRQACELTWRPLNDDTHSAGWRHSHLFHAATDTRAIACSFLGERACAFLEREGRIRHVIAWPKQEPVSQSVSELQTRPLLHELIHHCVRRQLH